MRDREGEFLWARGRLLIVAVIVSWVVLICALSAIQGCMGNG